MSFDSMSVVIEAKKAFFDCATRIYESIGFAAAVRCAESDNRANQRSG
jgi:hypothetical protein